MVDTTATQVRQVHEDWRASAGVSAEWQRAFAWIERELGGKIARFARQPRWRPAWYLDVERDGQTIPLYFRGDRGQLDFGVYSLEHEMRILEVLEAHDIPVPHVYGFCPDPRGIVMQRCPGRTPLTAAEDEAERRTVLDDYIGILTRMHRIDPAEFEAVGLVRPRTPEEFGLMDFDAWEKAYRKLKRRPEPLIEFVIRWVHRNVPQGRRRTALLHVDSGQFLFDQGRVSVVHDFELACLGDPAADLAGLRCRDLSYPLGDLARAIRCYGELVGEEVDLEAVDYHFVRFGICTPMSVAHLVADPPAEINMAVYLGWYLVYARAPIEVIARRLGVALEPIEIPAERPTRHTPAFRALLSLLESGVRKPGEADTSSGAFQGFGQSQGSDTHAGAQGSYHMDNAWRVAEYLRRAEVLGPAFEEQDLDEMAAIIGHRPANWAAGDAALEALVRDVGPERDAQLVRYFHRRLLRHEAILKPVMRELEHSVVQMIR